MEFENSTFSRTWEEILENVDDDAAQESKELRSKDQ